MYLNRIPYLGRIYLGAIPPQLPSVKFKNLSTTRQEA